MPSNFEPCFNRMKIDPVLMSEIQQLGGLTKNQELYIHYLIKKIIGYAELTKRLNPNKPFIGGSN